MPESNPTANVFKALMHPIRLSILDILRNGEQCVCHIEAVLGFRQAYISQHLMVLRAAGLVEDRRDGARIFYRVINPEVFELVDFASKLSGKMPAPGRYDHVVGCPCPKCNTITENTNHQKDNIRA